MFSGTGAVCDCHGRLQNLVPMDLRGPGCLGRADAWCLRRKLQLDDAYFWAAWPLNYFLYQFASD